MTLWLNGLAATCAEMLFQASSRSVYRIFHSPQANRSNFFLAFALAFPKRSSGPHEYKASLTFPFGALVAEISFIPAWVGQ